jgi:hypothetical protein
MVMTARKRYAYRLSVVYPEGVDWRNPPAAWEPQEWWGPEDGPSFSWPAPRVYFSRSGAKRRSDLLESYGCGVTIERSNEVTWPSDHLQVIDGGAA